MDPVVTGSLKAQVAKNIRRAIYCGHIGVGEPLREMHLAKELHVSQPTIREALMELEREGLVKRTRNIGTTVVNLSASEFRDRLEIRKTLEQWAAVRAAPNMTPEHFIQLEALLAALSRESTANSYYASAQADLEFHRFIWQRSGSEVLAVTLEQISAPIFALVSLLRSSGHHDLRRTMNSHTSIVQALRKGRAAEIEKAIVAHFKGSYEGFLNSGAEDFRAYAQTGAKL
jgi:DNA-binding GntR family transcriptional regulator